MYFSKKFKIIFILFLIIFASNSSYGSTSSDSEVGEIKPYTDISNNMLVNNTELEFYFTYRTKTEDNKMKDYKATTITCNGKKSVPYGKNYKVSLNEGINTITSTYSENGHNVTDNFKILCDTKEPSIQTVGIHKYMMVENDELYFKVKVKDDISLSENIKVQVRFKDTTLKPKDGQYHIVASKKDWNTVTVLASDEAGNSRSETFELVYYPIDISGGETIKQLSEYVPALGIDIKQSKGVIQGSSTELGTFGGYVVLKLDETLKNVKGPDLAIKGTWSSDNKPLYSVAVLKDSNRNGKPDESNWCYLSDEIEKEHNNEATYVTYIKDESNHSIGFAEINDGGNYTVDLKKGNVFVDDFDYSDLEFNGMIELDGILKSESSSSNLTTYVKENKYEIETGKTASGKKAGVTDIDFIKIYANSMLITEDGLPITTDVYYARFLSPTEIETQGREEYDHSNYPFYLFDDRLTFDRPINEYKAGDIVIVSYDSFNNTVPYDVIVKKKYFTERYQLYYKNHVKDNVDTRVAVTKIKDGTFSFVMPDTPVDVFVQLSIVNDDVKIFLDKYKMFSKDDLVHYKLQAIKRMETLYSYDMLNLSKSEEEQLLAIFELKNVLLRNKIVDDINSYSYDFRELLELKYIYDGLSIDFVNTLPEETLIKLDSAILDAVDQTITEGIINKTDAIADYKYGLGLSLSMQDIERSVKPVIKIKNKSSELSYTLYKDGRGQSIIPTPLSIDITK